MAKPASSKRGLTLLQCSDWGQKGWWEQAMCKSLTSFQKPLQPPGLLGLWTRETGRKKTQAKILAGKSREGEVERGLRKGRVTINCSRMPPEGHHRRQREGEKILLGIRTARWCLLGSTRNATPPPDSASVTLYSVKKPPKT